MGKRYIGVYNVEPIISMKITFWLIALTIVAVFSIFLAPFLAFWAICLILGILILRLCIKSSLRRHSAALKEMDDMSDEEFSTKVRDYVSDQLIKGYGKRSAYSRFPKSIDLVMYHTDKSKITAEDIERDFRYAKEEKAIVTNAVMSIGARSYAVDRNYQIIDRPVLADMISKQK